MTDNSKWFFDSALFIYYLEEHPIFEGKVVKAIEKAIESEARFVTSVVSLAEFGVVPARNDNHLLIAKFEAFLEELDFEYLKIDSPIASQAYLLRAKYPAIKLPDALQLGAALEAGCQKFITNDHRLKQITELEIRLLDDFA